MKFHPFQVSASSLLTACILAFPAILAAALPPLPAFIPDAPDKAKDLASYTAADVLSCIATEVRPKGHPVGNIYTQGAAKLKADWPGAKDATQIDAMLNHVLSATTPANKDDARKALLDVRFILFSVMDLTNTAKADAIVRVAQQQTDPLKQRLMANLASELFEDLFDPRLLTFIVEHVDDTTKIVRPPRRDGLHQTVGIVGNGIWSRVIQALVDVGFDEESIPVLGDDRAASKVALKAWMGFSALPARSHAIPPPSRT